LEAHLAHINGALCIHGGWLYGEGGIMTEYQYKHMIKRKQADAVTRGGNGRVAWLKYDSLPARYRRIYEAAHGDPHVEAAKNTLEDMIEFDEKTFLKLQEYEDADGVHLPKDTIRLYANNASILNALGTLMKNQRESNRSGVGGKFTAGRFWQNRAPQVGSLDPARWKNSLPQNARRLSQRYAEYVRDGYKTLIHGNMNNKHALKITEGEPESFMLELAAKGGNLNNAEVANIYNLTAKIKNWKPVTPAAVGIFREKHALEIHAGRYGKDDFHNRKTMQVTRSRPTGAMLYWTVDGWDAELAYQEKKKKVDGGYRTTYDSRHNVVFVLDPCCDYIIGYAIGDHENKDLITEAMRNAYRHVKELFGARYRVYQTQSDHYGKGAMKPMYTDASKHYTPARVKNAKAKAVERFNDWFNMTYLRHYHNWTGHNVDSTGKNQPTEDSLNLHRKDFPDADGCRMQIEKAISEDRQKKTARYRELWAKTPDDKKEVMSEEMYLYLFGTANGHRSRLQPDGLRVTIGGELYRFESFDIRFRQHGAVRWEVKYDPADLTQALAVNEDGTLRFMLEQKYVQPMALADRSEGDAAQLQRTFDFNDEMVEYVTAKRKKAGEDVEEMFRKTPQLNDTLLKFRIVDSDGQHKDRLNELRTATGRAGAQVTDAVLVEDDDDYEEVIFDERELRMQY
jgi:hypothetical protein